MKLLRIVVILIGLSSHLAVAQPTPTVPLQDAELQRRFGLADRGGKGAISRSEALQAGLLLDQAGDFDAIDRDKSGTITLFELSQFIAGEVQHWLAADADHDGGVTEAEAQRRSPSYLEVIRRADTDRDGAVTRDEFEIYGQRMYYQHSDLPSVAPNIFEKRF